jgi:ATPase family associated with various cellular activities (AAA)
MKDRWKEKKMSGLITLEELTNLIAPPPATNNPSATNSSTSLATLSAPLATHPTTNGFLLDVATNLLKLILWKKEVYNKRLQDPTLQQYQSELIKLIHDEKLSVYDIQTKYPHLYTNQRLFDRLKSIIQMIDERLMIMKRDQNFTHLSSILLDILHNPTKGIVSIEGESRQDIRQSLINKIYSLRNGFQQFTNLFANILLLGPAGVGKTSVARAIGYVLSKIGILIDERIIEVTTSSFLGATVGETATKTNTILTDALESVVFFDEAYEMGCVPKGDTRSMVMTELVKWMDTNAGLSVLIAAGYESEMKSCFLGSNEGLQRRFPETFHLTRYSTLELLLIFDRQVKSKMPFQQSPFSLNEKQYLLQRFYQMVAYTQKDLFSNQAGDMTNLSLFFVRTYYSSKQPWNQSSEQVHFSIINDVLKQFLTFKGVVFEDVFSNNQGLLIVPKVYENQDDSKELLQKTGGEDFVSKDTENSSFERTNIHAEDETEKEKEPEKEEEPLWLMRVRVKKVDENATKFMNVTKFMIQATAENQKESEILVLSCTDTKFDMKWFKWNKTQGTITRRESILNSGSQTRGIPLILRFLAQYAQHLASLKHPTSEIELQISLLDDSFQKLPDSSPSIQLMNPSRIYLQMLHRILYSVFQFLVRACLE